MVGRTLARRAGPAWQPAGGRGGDPRSLGPRHGRILTMLADTMMPEAFEHGGKLVGVFTTLGFALAFAISALE